MGYLIDMDNAGISYHCRSENIFPDDNHGMCADNVHIILKTAFDGRDILYVIFVVP